MYVHGVVNPKYWYEPASSKSKIIDYSQPKLQQIKTRKQALEALEKALQNILKEKTKQNSEKLGKKVRQLLFNPKKKNKQG